MSILKEQEKFAFTGRVNILHKTSGQFLGVILQENGVIVNARFKEVRGKKALLNLMVESESSERRERENLKYVVEPELLEEGDKSFTLSIDELSEMTQDLIKRVEKSYKLRPSPNLRVVLRGSFISRGDELTDNEFQVMKIVSDHAKIEEIYNKCDLLDYEITDALVSLRRKTALRVLKD